MSNVLCPIVIKMSESFYHKNSQLLQKLMQEVDISSIKELSSISGVSQWQLNRLLYGLMPKNADRNAAENI